MKYYRVFKYWWWYNVTISKDENHEDLKAITYYNMGKSAHATLWHFFILFISFCGYKLFSCLTNSGLPPARE